MERIPVIGLLAALPLFLLGCGGSDTNLSTQTQEAVTFDFSSAPPAEDLKFSVESYQEMNFGGRVQEIFLNYELKVYQWRGEDSTRSARVKFSRIKAMTRTGGAATMKPLDSFDELEGFSQRYRFDPEKGMVEVRKPNKTTEFLAVLASLSEALEILTPFQVEGEVAVGESWTSVEVADDSRFADVQQDSIATHTYLGDEIFNGRDCAKVAVQLEMPLEGVIESEEGSAAIKGISKANGVSYFDKALRLVVFSKQDSKLVLDIDAFDSEGNREGGSQTLDQKTEVKVRYLGD